MSPREFLQQNEPELLKYLDLNSPTVIVEKLLEAMDDYHIDKNEGENDGE